MLSWTGKGNLSAHKGPSPSLPSQVKKHCAESCRHDTRRQGGNLLRRNDVHQAPAFFPLISRSFDLLSAKSIILDPSSLPRTSVSGLGGIAPLAPASRFLPMATRRAGSIRRKSSLWLARGYRPHTPRLSDAPSGEPFEEGSFWCEAAISNAPGRSRLEPECQNAHFCRSR
jgi:hypothetical protein